ncbi:cache domain-containing protein [Pararhodospirillum oryzae]|uniref:Single Cache domain-containing protein n=1 Tax=Pararhodospirillum oryzae TaxID=478448 RepID=A0A512HAH1_9PROT|nr:cache domain-containing protein [Pararhodospirillum oryzae]GEO82453.1 hypothetical protein ROR02_25840 [Pararhodospirillum oryzae]
MTHRFLSGGVAASLTAAFLGLASVAALAQTPGRGTADEAVAMVHTAVSAIETEGKDAALAAITAKDPRFTDRDLFVFVWDMDGNTLAHAANARMVGKNLADATDVDGKAFARERLDLAKTQSGFWTDYKFSNPVTKKIEPKSTYCETEQAMLVCVGIYKDN